MTLHCLYLPHQLEALLAALGPDDGVLLLSTAVTLAVQPWVKTAENSVYALREDLAAHGIHQEANNTQSVDYAGWVSLTERYRTQQSWS